MLQHAVDFPGDAAQTIVSNCILSTRFLEDIGRNLATFEPLELCEQVTAPGIGSDTRGPRRM